MSDGASVALSRRDGRHLVKTPPANNKSPYFRFVPFSLIANHAGLKANICRILPAVVKMAHVRQFR